MSLIATLGDIVHRLDRAGVPHMVAGSVASTYHSDPRTTQDIDIVIDPTPEQLRVFVTGLEQPRYYVGDAEQALARRDQFNIIDTSSGWKVDFIIRRDRPFSLSEFERRQPADINGVAIFVATPEDTILAKLEWAQIGGSERQIRDVESIVRANRAHLDLDYLTLWASQLGVQSALETALDDRPDDAQPR